jgi:hypothetical protein
MAMDDSASDIEDLRGRVVQLEGRVNELARELDRAVRLIDRYGETLGNHLKLLVADHTAFARRLGNLERARARSG